MPRNTLSWIRCSLCGRRMTTRTYKLKGYTTELCPYCYTALSRPAGRRGGVKKGLDLDEGLLSKFGYSSEGAI